MATAAEDRLNLRRNLHTPSVGFFSRGFFDFQNWFRKPGGPRQANRGAGVETPAPAFNLGPIPAFFAALAWPDGTQDPSDGTLDLETGTSPEGAYLGGNTGRFVLLPKHLVTGAAEASIVSRTRRASDGFLLWKVKLQAPA